MEPFFQVIVCIMLGLGLVLLAVLVYLLNMAFDRLEERRATVAPPKPAGHFTRPSSATWAAAGTPSQGQVLPPRTTPEPPPSDPAPLPSRRSRP